MIRTGTTWPENLVELRMETLSEKVSYTRESAAQCHSPLYGNKIILLYLKGHTEKYMMIAVAVIISLVATVLVVANSRTIILSRMSRIQV